MVVRLTSLLQASGVADFVFPCARLLFMKSVTRPHSRHHNDVDIMAAAWHGGMVFEALVKVVD